VPRSVFEPLFAVPHGLDLSELARGLGWNAVRVTDPSSFTEALGNALRGGRHVIEVPVDRAANTAFHGAVSDALRSGLGREPLR
jgi:2-succinyl-5-enolpyruvyl-6-hydroxy-3-cyclohexene-1-carboxylate synthase